LRCQMVSVPMDGGAFHLHPTGNQPPWIQELELEQRNQKQNVVAVRIPELDVAVRAAAVEPGDGEGVGGRLVARMLSVLLVIMPPHSQGTKKIPIKPLKRITIGGIRERKRLRGVDCDTGACQDP